jgi:hypothetical protein
MGSSGIHQVDPRFFFSQQIVICLHVLELCIDTSFFCCVREQPFFSVDPLIDY